MSENPAAVPADLWHFDPVAGNVHFWPIGTSLFVSAWFIFMDSFAALF
jgi:hypothetical protein